MLSDKPTPLKTPCCTKRGNTLEIFISTTFRRKQTFNLKLTSVNQFISLNKNLRIDQHLQKQTNKQTHKHSHKISFFDMLNSPILKNLYYFENENQIYKSRATLMKILNVKNKRTFILLYCR